MTAPLHGHNFGGDWIECTDEHPRAGRSSDPEPAPPPDDRDWTAEFHALDDAINERLRAGAVPALQATGEPTDDFADIEGDDEDGNQP